MFTTFWTSDYEFHSEIYALVEKTQTYFDYRKLLNRQHASLLIYVPLPLPLSMHLGKSKWVHSWFSHLDRTKPKQTTGIVLTSPTSYPSLLCTTNNTHCAQRMCVAYACIAWHNEFCKLLLLDSSVWILHILTFILSLSQPNLQWIYCHG